MFFISYATNDGKEFARKLKRAIEKSGKAVWMDESSIEVGTAWRQKIDDGINTCNVMIVILTRGALESHNVTYEWTTAKALGKEVIPLIRESFDEKTIAKHIVFSIQGHHFINPKPSDWKELIDMLHQLHDKTDIPPQVLEADLALKKSVPSGWLDAIETLALIDEPAAVEVLAKHVSSKIPKIRILCALALAEKAKDKRSVPGLREALTVPVDGHKRTEQALSALGKVGGDDAALAIASIVPSENLSNIYQNHMVELGNTRSIAAIPKLLAIAASKSCHVHTRGAAIDALGNLKAIEALPFLIDLLLQYDNIAPHILYALKVHAARTLGKIKDETTIDALSKALCEDLHSGDQIGYKQECAKALAAIGTEKAIAELRKAQKIVWEPNIANTIKSLLG